MRYAFSSLFLLCDNLLNLEPLRKALLATSVVFLVCTLLTSGFSPVNTCIWWPALGEGY